MPWQISDVDSHKKGLTDKQKSQWVRIANSVLAACIKKGGTDKTCAPSAIKQANGVVGHSAGQYTAYKSNQDEGYNIELKVHQQKAHLVVPVVMMVEGVHNGSHGPLLHKIDDLGKFPASWNGIPVVINHPEESGQPISANSPEIIDSITVGRVYKTSVDDKKLKGQVWLDEEKLFEVAPEIHASVNEGKKLEVSIGVFTDDEEEEGNWEGEDYKAIAHNHRPDHLAILTDAKGACSLEDGCGLGANEESSNSVIHKSIWEKIRRLGYSIERIGKYSEQGYNELMSMIYDKLRSLDSDKVYNYLEECYDDYLIYSKSGDNKRTMYKQSYKVESGKIEFVGEPVEVHKKVEYVLNQVGNNSKKEVKMSKNECPKCLEKINKLLTNKESGFVETDREWLETLTEPHLDRVISMKVKEVEKIVEKPIEVNKLTDTQKAALAFGEKQLKERRERMTKVIQDNAGKETWPDEKLKGMDDDTLERVFNSVKKEEVVDYTLSSAGFSSNAESEEPPLGSIGVKAKEVTK